MYIYAIAGYFTLLTIKIFGGLKSMEWNWFYLGPLWLLLYTVIYFSFRFIIIPIIIVGGLILTIWLIMEMGMMPDTSYITH